MMLLLECSIIQVCYLALYGILLYKSMSWKKSLWRIENVKSMPTRSIISKKQPLCFRPFAQTPAYTIH